VETLLPYSDTNPVCIASVFSGTRAHQSYSDNGGRF
jgi:hypothetical protein